MMKKNRWKIEQLTTSKSEVLSVFFRSSQVYVISIVTYGARRLYSEEEKNEISIDDYLLNNTRLSFFPPPSLSLCVCLCVSCAKACWCARCRRRRRTG